MVATFRGGFRGVSGGLDDGVLSGTVPVENIDLTGPTIFRANVLAEGFFDAALHPVLSFRSLDIRVHGDGTVLARGELTIKGISKPVTAEGSVRGPLVVTLADGRTGERLGISLTTTVDRRDFGLNAAAGTDWKVTIGAALELRQR